MSEATILEQKFFRYEKGMFYTYYLSILSLHLYVIYILHEYLLLVFTLSLANCWTVKKVNENEVWPISLTYFLETLLETNNFLFCLTWRLSTFHVTVVLQQDMFWFYIIPWAVSTTWEEASNIVGSTIDYSSIPG